MPNGKAVQVAEFLEEPEWRGASRLGERFQRSLSMPDLKEVGHRFRMIQSDPLAIQLEEDRRSSGEALPELVNGAANFLPACFLEIGVKQVRAVCKIDASGVDYAGRSGEWTGTGFLVSPNLLLTNHHVLNSPDVAKTAWCIFNFQLGVDFTPLETVGFRLQPERLFVTSPYQGGLDYTFVWIEDGAARQCGWISMHRSAFTIHPGDYANLVQHPRGRQKELALQDNQVIQDTGLLLHYGADTEPGSSGCPVFNNRWELIGLHHASKPNAASLQPDKDRRAPPFLNEAIKLSSIAADLERRGQEGDSRALVVLGAFSGVDSLMGAFGGLGRTATTGSSGIERLVEVYAAEGADLDLGFLRAGSVACDRDDLLDLVTTMIADLNLDVWVLSDVTPKTVEALVRKLGAEFRLQFGHEFSETNGDAPSTAVIWNQETTIGRREAWPSVTDGWLELRSEQVKELELEPARGPVFDRYPGLFGFKASKRRPGSDPYELLLVPVCLGADDESSVRQRVASRVLATAVAVASKASAREWVICGDFAASIAMEEFQRVRDAGLMPLVASGPDAASFVYLKRPRSLLDRIYVPPSMRPSADADDFFLTVDGQQLPEYTKKLPDGPPLLVRLSLGTNLPVGIEKPRALDEILTVRRAKAVKASAARPPRRVKAPARRRTSGRRVRRKAGE
jgi:hypothetical protein